MPNTTSGTRRYMAPEILDDSMKTQWFEAYKQSDMYSMALIFWEIGRRYVFVCVEFILFICVFLYI